MSERGGRGAQRGAQRGQARGTRGGNHSTRGSHSGAAPNRPQSNAPAPTERPKKEAILDLAKFVDKQVRVKFTGGREVIGVLKGYDQLMNLVMDEVEEYIRDHETGQVTDKTRSLGLVVLRGTALTVINPADGFEQIANPFLAPE